MENKIICNTCKGTKVYQVSNLEFEECNKCKGKGYIIETKSDLNVDVTNELVRQTKIDSLLEVYNDLGTMKWAGADDSWDTAIEAVRKDLFNKIKKSLRKTDKIDLEQPVTIYYTDK